jgi:hypothetical protein
VILRDHFSSAVAEGSYFVALSYMRSIGLVDVHMEDQESTRRKLLKSIHAETSLSGEKAEYIQANISKTARKLEDAYYEFFKGMRKLGFECPGGFQRIMVGEEA